MLHTFYNCKILHKCITSDQSILNFLHAGFVEVGRVWLELPSPIHSSKPIQAILENRVQVGL